MEQITYDTLKRLMTSKQQGDRLEAASYPQSSPEVLYYLASDKADDVRQAVASNPNSPVKANLVLTRDIQDEVRKANALKIARLLPNLDRASQEIVFNLVVEALETMIADHLDIVRITVAQALCDYADTPPHIARQLAEDVEQQVAEPILRYCVAINDDDLLSIISNHPISWKLVAIAKREYVSARISDAIVNTGDQAAATALMGNLGAQITRAAMDELLHRAENGVTELQQAFKARPNVFNEMKNRVAKFVEHSVSSVLESKEDLNQETVENVQAAVARRLTRNQQQKTDKDLTAYAIRLAKEGKLNEEEIGDALANDELDFVKIALSLRADIHPGIVDKIFDAHSSRGITALTWRAKLSPRFALKLQQSKLGQINYRQLLYPKNAGDDFPLTIDELNWQLEFFGVR